MVDKDKPEVQDPKPQGPQQTVDLSAVIKKGAEDPSENSAVEPTEKK